MKIDLNKLIVNFNGEALKNDLAFDPKNPEKELPNMTASDVILRALGTTLDGDTKEDEKVKYARWELGKRIAMSKKGNIDLTSEECVLIKSRVKEAWPSSVIYGNIADLIDPPKKD